MAEILTEMLNSVPNQYDKSTGSFIFDALAPAAEQLEKIDNKIFDVKNKLLIDNLSGTELAAEVTARTGIERNAATYATGSVSLIGNGTVNIGDLFETVGGIRFQATETKNITESGTIQVRAVIAGTTGNVAAGVITLFPVTLPGFTSVNNPNETTGGYAAESDADLLARYYERIRTPATSGNKAQYVAWAKSINGVGGAKAVPLWDGVNTVKVVIIGTDKKPAVLALVEEVQDYIDPGITGLGDGVAPAGAFCTVESATGVDINITVSISLESGVSLETATENIINGITLYLEEIAFKETFVSYAKIGSAIINSVGVEDYADLTVNGSTSNVSIGTYEVAVLGEVIVL